VTSGTSITQLFLAVMVPWLLLALRPRASPAEVWAAFNAAKWAR